jgi:hypothetical protein
MVKRKKVVIDEEIDDFELDSVELEDYHDSELEDMINDILKGDPDDPATIDNLSLVVEWIKRKL